MRIKIFEEENNSWRGRPLGWKVKMVTVDALLLHVSTATRLVAASKFVISNRKSQSLFSCGFKDSARVRGGLKEGLLKVV